MDGPALAAELRRYPQAQSLPLVLFSSLGGPQSAPELKAFQGFLSKPLKPSVLFDTLMSILGAQQARAAPAAATEAPKPDREMAAHLPLRILLAEDNVVNQKLAVHLLGQMGYRPDVVANGLEVLRSLERQPYDVILMDVQMPEMDGLEASRRICARWPSGQHPRIIAMTANAMQGDREKCLEAGMDDYVSKPIRVEELRSALSRSRPLEQRSTP